MKISVTLSFLALLPTIGAQCDYCPSGITGGNATVVPDADGATCEGLAFYAMTNISTIECGQMKTGAQPICCPADVGPGCDFCPTGVENDVIVDESDGTTCGLLGLM
jgi:hypothetical protein